MCVSMGDYVFLAFDHLTTDSAFAHYSVNYGGKIDSFSDSEENENARE